MKLRIVFILLVFCSGVVNESFAQENKSEAKKIAKDLYQVIGTRGGNVAFYVTDSGVVVIDAGNMPADGRKIIEQIKIVTDKSIKYLIYTHYHGDHINGCSAFPKDVIFIGHSEMMIKQKELSEPDLKVNIDEELPKFLEEQKKKIAELEKNKDQSLEKEKQTFERYSEYFKELKTVKIRYPELTFEKEMLLQLGGKTIKLIYPGVAHTSGNILVIFKDINVIHMGDMLFNNVHPYCLTKSGVNTQNWLKQLHSLLNNKYDVVIPGHGELTDMSGIKKQAEYFETINNEVKKGIKGNVKLEEITKNINEKYFKGISGNQLENNIKVIYRELSSN